jgi:hypothetical protein
MRYMNWAAALCYVEIGASIVGCRNSSLAPHESLNPQPMTQAAQSQAALPDAGDEQSCRAFVQGFYDWYWNQASGNSDTKPHGYDEALALKPAALSPELIRLIKRDDARARAAGGIANLDFDPYLNSQDPSGKYELVQVTMNGGLCRAKLSQRDVIAEAKRNGPGWLFSNFYYRFYSEDGRKKVAPDDDLVRILNQP